MPDDTAAGRLSEHQWRILWEERLDSSVRRRVWKACLRGEALEDADEAAVAIEFARRRRRVAGIVALANSVGFLALLGIMAFVYEPPVTSTFWFMTAIWVLGLVASPLLSLSWRRRLGLAEVRNRQVLGDIDG